MKRVYDYLKEAGTYYLATVDGEQPRVRPFGTVNVLRTSCTYRQARERQLQSKLPLNQKLKYVQ